MSDDAPNRAWAIEEAARAALLAIEQGKSFDHLDNVIAPALRQALRDSRIANTELRRPSACGLEEPPPPDMLKVVMGDLIIAVALVAVVAVVVLLAVGRVG